MGGDGDALDVFHDEIGSSILGLPRVENFGDGRVVHHGQGLSLGLETGDDLSCVHACLDELQGHAAVDGFVLLGDPDFSHPALADFLEEMIGTDHPACLAGGLERFGLVKRLFLIHRASPRINSFERERLYRPQVLAHAWRIT